MNRTLPPSSSGSNHWILSGSNDWTGPSPASLMGPPRPFVGEPTWPGSVCDAAAAAAAVRVPLSRVKRRLKVCVCVKHWKPSGSVQAPRTLHSTLLRSTLLYSGRRPELYWCINGRLVLRWDTHTHWERKLQEHMNDRQREMQKKNTEKGRETRSRRKHWQSHRQTNNWRVLSHTHDDLCLYMNNLTWSCVHLIAPDAEASTHTHESHAAFRYIQVVTSSQTNT